MENRSDKDAFYFPHFSNARNDRKIRRLRKELGIEGYGIFFIVLEVLRDQPDYKYPIEDIDLLADEIGTSEQKVKAVVGSYDLFDVNEDNMFFSSNLIMYLQPYLQGKERKRISGIRGNLIRYNHITKEQSKGMSDDDILLRYKELNDSSQCDSLAIAIKVKEKRTNEKKINKTSNEFRMAQLLYDLHREKIDKNFKKTDDNLNKWAIDIDRLHRIDSRDYDEIEKVIRWCKDDRFWSPNIVSGSKLRKQYDVLVAKMNTPFGSIKETKTHDTARQNFTM